MLYYELGKTRIPVDSLIILAKFYNVDMNYISDISNIKNPFPRKIRYIFSLLIKNKRYPLVLNEITRGYLYFYKKP